MSLFKITGSIRGVCVGVVGLDTTGVVGLDSVGLVGLDNADVRTTVGVATCGICTVSASGAAATAAGNLTVADAMSVLTAEVSLVAWTTAEPTYISLTGVALGACKPTGIGGVTTSGGDVSAAGVAAADVKEAVDS